MLQPVSLGTSDGKRLFERLSKRKFRSSGKHEETVRQILSDVRSRGDQAVLEYTRRFDAPGMEISMLKVSEGEIREAYAGVDSTLMESLGKAIRNIRAFHEKQLPNSWIMTRENGVVLGQQVRPVDSAGLYVPGGKAGSTPLVSSVLMNAIPAVIAGVERIVMATPPDPEGKISPGLLVAAREVGVSEIFKMGSAWAIGALAYGTESVAPVDVIVGPGNIFVTLAKKMVAGAVGIDMIAGPSEVLVIADNRARPDFIAADMLSQAEHDPMATAILVTDSADLASEVSKELERQLSRLPRSETARKALDANGAILLCGDMAEAAEIANALGPEHLELLVEDPWMLVTRIRHAGAIFMGPYTPEPVGDYIAGPNHVLPTMGTARFSSALGVETFIKRSSLISYSKEALHEDAGDVIRLASLEGLDAHARSIEARVLADRPK